MYFANPWGLMALTSLPAIVVLHMYQRRFPVLNVAGLHLWSAEARERTAGRRRERLPITASLLLELLAAFLLSLVLSQPRFGDLTSVTHLVVVLDNSASMMARPPGEAKSFRDLALDALQSRVESLERNSVLTVILTGRRPVMLVGPAIGWQQAEPPLRDWRPTAQGHEFQSAWDLAAQLARDTGQLLFVTDLVPGRDVPLPRQMEVISVGQKLDNVAITAARWSFDSKSATGNVFVRLSNLGGQRSTVSIRGKTGDQVVFEQTVQIAAATSVPMETPVAGGLGQLTLELQAPGDGLAIDNQVTLIEPKLRLLTLAVTFPPAHSANRPTRRVLEAIPDVQFSSVEQAELMIGPAAAPPPNSRRNLWWLGIGPANETASESTAVLGPYVLEKRDPLLDGVVLGGVVWGGIQKQELAAAPLISAGPHVLLSRLLGTQSTAYLLNIDLGRSNLGESPDWPILLSNLLQLRRDNLPGLRRFNYRLNEEIRFRSNDSPREAAAALTLIHAGSQRPLVRAPIVEVPPLAQAGVYTIMDGEQEFGKFAINFFDVAESTLTGLRPGSREPIVVAGRGAYALDNPYSWLILLGILLIMLAALADWYVLRPRQSH